MSIYHKIVSVYYFIAHLNIELADLNVIFDSHDVGLAVFNKRQTD